MHIGVGAGPVRLVRFWPDHFFGDLMKFIIEICARAVTVGIPYARAYFKSPSYDAETS